MVSTLKVNKIQIPNSDSDVISLDASSGNITIPKNITVSGTLGGTSITVQGEGTNTTNLQQGLVKCWFLDNEGGTGLDSFNVASATDNGTGDYTKTFTNNFSSDNLSAPAACAQNTSFFVINKTRATSSVTQFNIKHDNTSLDGRQNCVVCGDLA